MSELKKVLIDPDNVDAVFCKILTPNDDSGRHGVLIPITAYGIFPSISGFDPSAQKNYTEPITTLWKSETGIQRKASSFKHYHRYPERRITALRSQRLNNAPANSMILVARHKDNDRIFEIHVFYPDEPAYKRLIDDLKIALIKPGIFYLDKEWDVGKHVKQSEALLELLELFDRIKAKGFIRTLRPGPTGVGYTFETLIGIKENNDSLADFRGIEIKTFRSAEIKMNVAEKTNLFLKEPCWSDGLSNMADRVRKYGYIDEDGRCALYSTVKIDVNSHNLKFVIASPDEKVYIERQSVPIAFYRYDDIRKRLCEKHNETAFIAAQAKGKGSAEEFHYRALTYCVNPSITSFMALLASGNIMLELRMHINTKGGVRNHGTAFRVMKNRIPDLFETVHCLRD